MNLLELVSSPRFIFARQSNFAFTAQVVEALNNLVQYQFDSNAQVRSH